MFLEEAKKQKTENDITPNQQLYGSSRFDSISRKELTSLGSLAAFAALKVINLQSRFLPFPDSSLEAVQVMLSSGPSMLSLSSSQSSRAKATTQFRQAAGFCKVLNRLHNGSLCPLYPRSAATQGLYSSVELSPLQIPQKEVF